MRGENAGAGMKLAGHYQQIAANNQSQEQEREACRNPWAMMSHQVKVRHYRFLLDMAG